jgi:transcriptional regulator with XRE-family HTH domain
VDNNSDIQRSEAEPLPSHIKTLGAAVRFLRERAGLSLRQAARLVGVSSSFLSDLERDRRHTTKIEELAQALGCKAGVLKELDTRLSADLREWIAANPGMVAVLREMRATDWRRWRPGPPRAP